MTMAPVSFYMQVLINTVFTFHNTQVMDTHVPFPDDLVAERSVSRLS